jgi:hypothetical protein
MKSKSDLLKTTNLKCSTKNFSNTPVKIRPKVKLDASKASMDLKLSADNDEPKYTKNVFKIGPNKNT